MANTIRTSYEDLYYLSYQTTSISTAGTFTATDDGISALGPSGQCGLLLTDHPDLMPGKVQDYADKTTGLAQRRYDTGNQYEYTDGRRTPTVSLNMGLNAYRLKILGWLLGQQGATETTNEVVVIPPVAGGAAMEVWASIGRSFGDPSGLAVGHAIHGCICNQLQITGNAGERCNIIAQMSGRSMVTNFDHTNSVATIETAGENMFFDFDFSFATNDIGDYMEGFDITINNNAVARHYGSQTPSHYVMGKWETTGTVRFAMSAEGTTIGDNNQIDNFIGGTDVLLDIEHASISSGTNGYIRIRTNMLYSGDPSLDPAEELTWNCPFEGVYDGTNQSIALTANNGRSDSIPA